MPPDSRSSPLLHAVSLGACVTGLLLSCAVTLDFSQLSPAAPFVAFDDVPINETVGSVLGASAGLLNVSEGQIAFLRADDTSINPRTPLSSLVRYGNVELRVIPRDYVGGDRAETSAGASSSDQPPSHPRHPGRRCVELLEPVEQPNRDPNTRWKCMATVEQDRTGKGAGKSDAKTLGPFFGATPEEAVRDREETLREWLHPKPRAAATGKRFAPAVLTRESRPRTASPANLAEPKAPSHPTSEQARAGPGRGHKLEAASTSALEEPIRIEQMKAEANWFEQHAARQSWQTRRIAQLERELCAAQSTIACQAAELEALRAKALSLESALHVATEEITSYMETPGGLKQAAHKALEDHPEWKEIIGVGYSSAQQRDLIYKHLQKLLDLTRSVTRGDSVMAKQLIDLLHARAHTGEQRSVDVLDRARERTRRLNEGIALSLRDFVHLLHDAGGKGRYPDKLRQAMQVVATSVSQAAIFAKVPVKDVADALGLNRDLISKCKARYDALLNDGDWEQLFDDRGATRSDTLSQEWLDFALGYWTQEDLGYVRRSERMSAAIRNPNDRKAPKERLFSLEGRIGDMYESMKATGIARFGDKFHVGMTKFRELRPFYVKGRRARRACVSIIFDGPSSPRRCSRIVARAVPRGLANARATSLRSTRSTCARRCAASVIQAAKRLTTSAAS